MTRRAGNSMLLLPVEDAVCVAVAVAGLCAHLDEHERVLVLGDKVDFTILAGKITGADAKSFSAKKLFRQLLSFFS